MQFDMEAARIASEKVFGKIGKVALWVVLVIGYFVLTEVGLFMALDYLIGAERLPPIFAFVLWALSMGNVISIVFWLGNYNDALTVVKARREKEEEQRKRDEARKGRL